MCNDINLSYKFLSIITFIGVAKTHHCIYSQS